jgi:hypothetical protein
MAVLKISAIFLKYPTFDLMVFFSYLHGQNKYKIRVSVPFSVCTGKSFSEALILASVNPQY